MVANGPSVSEIYLSLGLFPLADGVSNSSSNSNITEAGHEKQM